MGERTCAVEGCERSGRITRGWCWTHYMRWWHSGEVGPAEIGKPGQGYPVAGRHPNYADSSVGYFGAHRRVREKHGPAKNYACAECGGHARHWAYDHDDPSESTSPDGLSYSPDPEHYIPLCVRCHSRIDRAVRG